MKKLFAILSLIIMSCGSDFNPAQFNNTIPQADSVKTDSVSAVTVPSSYVSPYAPVIDAMLQARMECIIAETNMPHSMFSQKFYDLHSVEKAPIEVVKHYERLLEDFIESQARNPVINFEHFENDSIPIIIAKNS